jgi:hypothetical protein
MEDKRKSGRTTRLIDDYIQLLFEVDKGQSVKVRDHYPSNDAHRQLLERIVRRLKNEHPGLQFEYDIRERSIKRV